MLVFQPMPLGRKPLPFDDPAYLFKLKYDGFRALAVVEYGRCTLYSRNGHSFASFPETELSTEECLEDLRFERTPESIPHFAFSCTWLCGHTISGTIGSHTRRG